MLQRFADSVLLMSASADVGTKLYIAPEVQSGKGGARNHAKADIYSLGVRLIVMVVLALADWPSCRLSSSR